MKTSKSIPPADASRDEDMVAQVRSTVISIPPGKVMGYGAVGARCRPAISGYICGRIMQGIGGETPWWRVVGKKGDLPVSKRRPEAAEFQREKLENEGVEFDDDGRVEQRYFVL